MSITPQELKIVKQLTGSFFSDRRQQLGLTQQEVAEKSGVRNSTVQRIEEGKFIPGGETLLILLTELNLALVFQNKSENESFTGLLEKTWAVPKRVNHSSAGDFTVDMVKSKTKIGDFFVNRRQQLGWTQKEVADQARLGEATIHRIEYGRQLPDGKGLLKICEALQCVFYPIDFTGEFLVFAPDN